MRKFGKIIALTILLATVLSLFAGFGVFAAEAGAAAPKNLFSQVGGGKFSIANAPATMAQTSKTATNGVPYTTFSYKDGWTVDKGGYTKEPYIQFAPATHYLKDGYQASAAAPGTDDTDYLVIDLDISTDTNQFDQLYFQTLFYYGKFSSGSTTATRTSAQSGHYVLFGDAGEEAYFTASTAASTKIPINVQSDDEWAHITMVVDATADTNRTMHLYYNGQFISSRVCMTSNAVYLESVRISLGTAGVAPDIDNESVSLANVTVKSFPKGYTGELAEEKANLGSELYPLSSFSDLGYCLEKLPENTIAEITHADETVTAVTKISDLDGNLVAGDSVKLYRDIARKIVVPGKTVDGELVSAVNFELNGHTMVDPLLLENYGELDWIVRNEKGELYSYTDADTSEVVYGMGAQVYTDGKLTTDNLDAFIKKMFPSGITGNKTVKFTFLKDTTVKYTAALRHGQSNVTYDLNKQTLTLGGGSVNFQCYAASSRVVIRDGKMINGTSNPVYMDYDGRYYIKDVELVVNNSFVDQRRGVIFFIDSKISGKETVVSIKSYSDTTSKSVFDGCEINMNGANPISFSNLRTASARRGSMDSFVGVYNTNAYSTASIVNVAYYANEWQGGDADAKANQNLVTMSIQGSTLGTDNGAAIIVGIDSLADLNNSYTFAEGFDATTNIYIADSEFNTEYVVCSDDDTASSIIKTQGVTVGNYTAYTNVTIKSSELNTPAYIFGNTIGTGDVNGGLVATLYDGVKLATKEAAPATHASATIATAEGVKVAYSSDEAYPYIATSTYRDFTYEVQSYKGDSVAKSGEFAWNGTDDTVDAVDMSRILALPEATTEYKYTDWALDGTTYVSRITPLFALNANLTASSDFYLNVYLSANVNLRNIYMTVDGNIVTQFSPVTAGGTSYYKAADQVIKGITPEKLAEAHVVGVSFEGGFGETVELSATVSVEAYLKMAYAGKDSLSENGEAFIQAIINYVVAANDYAGTDGAASLADYATEIAAPEYTDAKWEALAGVEAAINLGDSARWVFNVEAGETYILTYGDISRKCVADKNNQIILGIKAVDLTDDITITDAEGNSATVNLAGYYENVNDAEAETVVAALYNYSVAAQAFAPELHN